MLAIRPNCECCDKELPANSKEAYICSYECTFCKKCLDEILQNVCPNCGGGLTARPIRPATSRRKGLGLAYQPAEKKRTYSKYSQEEISIFSEAVKDISPEER